MRTIIFLLRKEFLQIRRDTAMLRLLVLVPIVQLLVLASAATFEIRQARVYLVDEDLSSASRGLVDRQLRCGRGHRQHQAQRRPHREQLVGPDDVAILEQVHDHYLSRGARVDCEEHSAAWCGSIDYQTRQNRRALLLEVQTQVVLGAPNRCRLLIRGTASPCVGRIAEPE